MNIPHGPFIVILSSPSGGGKSTVANAILTQRSDTTYSVSATTRRPRKGEVDGKDYFFLSEQEFAEREANGEMLESTTYSGHRYGTLKSEIERVLAAGQHALLDIEVEGAQRLRERQFKVLTIFILPPSAEVLVARLGGRRSDSHDQVIGRIRRAIDELAEVTRYDYVVINDDIDECVAEVSSIMNGQAESLRTIQDMQERITDLRAGLRAYLDRQPGE